MNLNLKTMDKTWRNAGLITLAAGLLAYPVYRLVKYAINRSKASQNETGEEHTGKSFLPSYRGKHKPHHRKAEANGHLSEATA